MVLLYQCQSPSVRPLKSVEIQPGVNLSSSNSSKVSKLQELLQKRTHSISPHQPIVPKFPSNPIKFHHKCTHIFSVNSLIYSNFPARTHAVPPKKTKYSKFSPKLTKFQKSSITHSAITKSQTHKKFPPKSTKSLPIPINSQLRNSQFFPATSQVLAQIFKHGPLPDIITYTTFIKLLGDSGHAAEALELFALMRETHEPDVVSFTVLIRILCDSKMVDQALDLLHEMPKYNCKPDLICYNTLIDKLGEAGHKEHVWKLWTKMQSEDIHPDVVTYSSLVKSLCVMSKIHEASLVLGSMEESRSIKPNSYVYNTIITAYLDHSCIKEALGVLGRMMVQGCTPDLCSFNLFIKYYSDLGEGLEAYMFLRWIIRMGIEASESSYSICIHGLIKQGKVAEVMELIEKIKLSSVTIDICTWNKLIMRLSEMGRLDEAYEIFLGLKHPNEVTMNTVIHMLYKHRRGVKAWEVFNQMEEKKIKASIVTFNILVHWLAREQRVSEAFELVNQMETEKHLLPDVITYNCLLDGLCNIGQVDDACRLILAMSKKGCQPDLVTYNTLINGMVKVGRMDDASRLFEHMRGELAAYSFPLEILVEDMLRRQ